MTTLMEERIRAGACFLYPSGMRVNAFVSLPIRAVNISEKEVQQLPSLGVRTKFKKAAITFLLDVPELLNVVQCWDNRVRPVLPPQSPWFAPISPLTGELDPNCHEPSQHRDAGFRHDLQEWLAKVGGTYHSPHKFRRGHAVFCLTNAVDYADMEAAMANLMHENMAMTEKYMRLKRAEIKKRITRLGKTAHPDMENSEFIDELETFLARLKGANP